MSIIKTVLTKHHAQGTLGSTDTSSPHCGEKRDPINAELFWLLIRAKASEAKAGLRAFKATKWWKFQFHSSEELTWGLLSRLHAGRLDGHSAARTLWEPATHASPADRQEGTEVEGALRCKRAEGEREREKIRFICGQSFFNSDARGF